MVCVIRAYMRVSLTHDPPLYPQNFEDNSTLQGILSDLIIPAVKRKELPMREKGLVSLGLCCLIAKVPILFQIPNPN